MSTFIENVANNVQDAAENSLSTLAENWFNDLAKSRTNSQVKTAPAPAGTLPADQMMMMKPKQSWLVYLAIASGVLFLFLSLSKRGK